MEQNLTDSSAEKLRLNEVERAVGIYLTPIICYCAIKKAHFPMDCLVACKLLQQEINASYDFNLILYEGSRTDTNSNHRCPSHIWLECGDLIIDPTDFQFKAISYDLPIIDENFIPQDINLDGLSEEELYSIYSGTYTKNCYKNYLENPNEKERNFQELVDSLKNGQISQEEFVNELRISYGCKTFYSKSDHESGIIYEQNAKHAE